MTITHLTFEWPPYFGEWPVKSRYDQTRLTNMHDNRESFRHMANQLIKKSNKRSFWVAIMARQMGIWSVTWLKCMENGQWPHVISDSEGMSVHPQFCLDFLLRHNPIPLYVDGYLLGCMNCMGSNAPQLIPERALYKTIW